MAMMCIRVRPGHGLLRPVLRRPTPRVPPPKFGPPAAGPAHRKVDGAGVHGLSASVHRMVKPLSRPVGWRRGCGRIRCTPAAAPHVEPTPEPPAATLIQLAEFVPWPKVWAAWACTGVALACILALLPRVGQLTTLVGAADLSGVLRLGGVVLGLLTLRVAAQYGQDVMLAEVSQTVVERVRNRVHAHLHTLDLAYFEHDAGRATELAYRVSTEAELAGDVVWASAQRGAPGLLQLAAIAGGMILQSPTLFLTCVLLAAAMSISIAGLGERLRQRSEDAQSRVAEFAAYITEVLSTVDVVRVHSAEPVECARGARLARTVHTARLRAAQARALLPVATTLLYGITVLAIFAVGAYIIGRHQMDAAGLISFLTSLVLLIEPIQACTDAYNEVKQKEAGAARVLEPLNDQPSITEHASPVALSRATDTFGVRFHNVHFRYATGERVLNGVSFDVKAGQLTAIVGPSGSGKSTLAKLLLRLYEPQEGYIGLARVSLASLREHVAYVPQDAGLMRGSLSHNITYGCKTSREENHVASGSKPEAERDGNHGDGTLVAEPRVMHAVRQAGATEFVTGLAEGLQTAIGHRGSGLSGGQQQRIALARALYRQPALLVLDEPTSAQDAQTASAIRGTIAEQRQQGTTVLLIAHDLKAVEGADQIVVMQDGQVSEQGNHADLWRKRGLYWQLYTKQQTTIGDALEM